MKKSKKNILTTSLAVALAAALLAGGGTFAYLRGETTEVKNTFDTNKVMVDLSETGDGSYDIIPGTSQTKDPKVTVDNTVDAYVYVEVTDTTEGLVTYEIADGWTKLNGAANVYYREVKADETENEFPVLKDNKVTYDASLENSDMLDEEGNLKDGIELSFKAIAMQKEPFNDPVKAYFQTENTIVTLGAEASAAELQTAIDAAEGKTAIVVENEITTDKMITIKENQEIILSLDDGAKIENTTEHAIKNEGSLTVKGGTIDAQAHAKAAVYNEVGATAVLDDVTLTRSLEAGTSPADNGSNSYYAVFNHGTMTLNNCEVSADGKYSSLIENGWQNGNQNTNGVASTLTINGGTYSGGINTVKNDDYGVLVINGGVFENIAQYAVMNHNIATINGGTFISMSSAVYNCACDENMDKGELTINGGNFNYPSNYYGIYDVSEKGTIKISGGTFATQYISNNGNVIADGYQKIENVDGTYSVVAE